MGSVATLVEALKEGGLVLVAHFLVIGETLELRNVCSGHRSNLVENLSAPNVTLLDVIKPFVASTNEIINIFWVTHAVVLSPVLSELKLCLLWGGVATETVPVDNERHVAAVLAEKTQTFHVSLYDVAGACGCRYLI